MQFYKKKWNKSPAIIYKNWNKSHAGIQNRAEPIFQITGSYMDEMKNSQYPPIGTT